MKRMLFEAKRVLWVVFSEIPIPVTMRGLMEVPTGIPTQALLEALAGYVANVKRNFVLE